MSETNGGENLPRRLTPPFPSRRELHRGAIPQRPEGAPDPVPILPPVSDPVAGPVEEAPEPKAPPQEETAPQKPQSRPAAKSPYPPRRRSSTEFIPVSAEAIPVDTTNTGQTVADTEVIEASSEFDTLLRSAEESSPEPAPSSPTRPKSPAAGRPAGAPQKRRRRGPRPGGIVLILLVLALVGGGGWWAVTNLFDNGIETISGPQDFPGPGTGAVEVTVEPGDLGTTIGNRLYDLGVVKSVEAFTKAFNANSASASIKPGTYTLKLEMSAAEALAALLDEANRVDNALTVNPGQRVADVREKMLLVAGFSEADVDAVISDPSETGLPEQAGGNLEGWLWAGSYEIAPGDTPTAVFARMVAPTVEHMTETGRPADEWQEILTKASIVEREVAWEEHMPKVARVIENRLADPAGETLGKLQMDSTLNYGVGKSGGMPDTEDFANDNPYNTYMYAGLPPTPIATPSVAAIEAVLNPAEGNWLYFVTINLETGETLFTDSYNQMVQDIEKLTEWCKANQGKC